MVEGEIYVYEAKGLTLEQPEDTRNERASPLRSERGRRADNEVTGCKRAGAAQTVQEEDKWDTGRGQGDEPLPSELWTRPWTGGGGGA